MSREDETATNAAGSGKRRAVEKVAKQWAIVGLILSAIYVALAVVLFIEPLAEGGSRLPLWLLVVALLNLLGSLFALNKSYKAAWIFMTIGGCLGIPLGLVMLLAGDRLKKSLLNAEDEALTSIAQTPESKAYQIGILFNLDELGDKYWAYKILFQTLEPERLKGSILFDGFTAEGHAKHFCIAINSGEEAPVHYVREVLADLEQKGLPPPNKRFISTTTKQPLVQVGMIDERGAFVVRRGSTIGSAWVKGSAWTVKRS